MGGGITTSEPRWEGKFARDRWPLAAGAVGRSVLAAHPTDHRREYYRALGAAVAAAARRKALVPVERFLTAEVWVRYAGLEYLLTPDSSFGYFLHAFEPRTARDLMSRGGEVFIDAGANTGQYAVPLARHFRRGVAIEPNPVAARILRRNLERNHIENVRVLERLVLPTAGRGRLFEGDVLTTWGTVTPSERSIEVEAVTLDDLLGDHARIDLLKLDIEGREAEVLLSAHLLDRVRAISFSGFPEELEKVRGHLQAAGFALRQPAPLFRSIENFIAERPASGSRQPPEAGQGRAAPQP